MKPSHKNILPKCLQFMKPHFFPKTAKKPTCYDKNKWEKKNETVKTVKNFHCKNETRKTVKKEWKSRYFSKSPSRMGYCNSKRGGKKNLYGKIIMKYYQKCVLQWSKNPKKIRVSSKWNSKNAILPFFKNTNVKTCFELTVSQIDICK